MRRTIRASLDKGATHSQQPINELELVQRVDQQQTAQKKRYSDFLTSLKELLRGIRDIKHILSQMFQVAIYL